MRAVSSRVPAVPLQHARWRLAAILVAAGLGASVLVPPPAFAQTVNQPPIAQDDEYNVDAGTTTELDVLSNDSDPDGDPLTITAVTGPTNGSTVLAAGVLTYTPNAGFTGQDTFTYTVSDGHDHSDSATVTVTVEDATPPSDPVTADDSATTSMGASVTIDVLANDTPSDAANALAVTSATMPANGGVVVNGDGMITYTPDAGFTGTDTFDYTVSEDGGGTATATVTITVQSSPGNGNGNGNGNGGGCADGEWVHLGFSGLGFCLATPNPSWTEEGEQIFPDGLFPGGLFPHGLFPDGVFGHTGGSPSHDPGDPLESVAAPAAPAAPDGRSLAEEIIEGVHAALEW